MPALPPMAPRVTAPSKSASIATPTSMAGATGGNAAASLTPPAAQPQPQQHKLVGRAVVFRRHTDRSGRWLEGTIQSVNSEAGTVTIYDPNLDRTVTDVAPTDVAVWDDSCNLAALDDLSHMRFVAPAAAMYALQQRYYGGLPYTAVGDRMLVAINPYRPTPVPASAPSPKLVAKRVMEQLRQVATSSSSSGGAPASALVAKGSAPSIMPSAAVAITGTSGAGKTECAKMVLSELFRLCSPAAAAQSSSRRSAACRVARRPQRPQRRGAVAAVPTLKSAQPLPLHEPWRGGPETAPLSRRARWTTRPAGSCAAPALALPSARGYHVGRGQPQ